MTDKKDDALKLALEALEYISSHYMSLPKIGCMALAAVEEALAEQPVQSKECQCPACKIAPHESDCLVHNEPAWPNGPCDCGAQPEQEPEFFTHSVDQPYDWSDWVCPDPKSYLMKCCDCGLVHEAQFGVVRYKSETEREDCDMVDDPNLQAVFRMRRSEQWSPEDRAYRPGGLAQPERPAVQGDPDRAAFERHWKKVRGHKKSDRELKRHPLQPQTYVQDSANRHWVTWQAATRCAATPQPAVPERKPLTDEEIDKLPWEQHEGNPITFAEGLREFARAIEAAHGITGESK